MSTLRKRWIDKLFVGLKTQGVSGAIFVLTLGGKSAGSNFE
jgi:hypothetical protein